MLLVKLQRCASNELNADFCCLIVYYLLVHPINPWLRRAIRKWVKTLHQHSKILERM
jgi:hypothetical protein